MKAARWVTGMVGLAVLAAPATVDASSGVDRALGNGLGRLLAPKASARSAQAPGRLPTFDQERLTIRDAQGRVLVDLSPARGTSLATLRTWAQGADLAGTTTDRRLRSLEWFVPVGAVPRLAALKG